MRYKELVNTIQKYSKRTQLVRSFSTDDVYDTYNRKDIEYGNLCVGLQNTTLGEHTVTYSILIYYADRLTTDHSNRLEVWDDAVWVLKCLVDDLSNVDDIEIESDAQIQTFEQSFADLLAGGYLTLQVNCELDQCDLYAADVDVAEEFEILLQQIKVLGGDPDPDKYESNKEAQLEVLRLVKKVMEKQGEIDEKLKDCVTAIDDEGWAVVYS